MGESSQDLSPFERAIELIELASIYAEDGAVLTAAERLEAAAAIFRDLYAQRMALIAKAEGR